MEDKFRKINLQLFADDVQSDEIHQDVADTSVEKESENTQIKTYTDDDINVLKQQWQKESEEEYNTKLKEAIKNALEEEKRKAKLSKDELEQEEKKKLLEEIEALRNEKNTNELKEKARTLLDESKLPNSFLSMVLGTDEKVTADNISALKVEFDKAVQAMVEERLKGNTPSGGGNTSISDSVDEQIANALGL